MSVVSLIALLACAGFGMMTPHKPSSRSSYSATRVLMLSGVCCVTILLRIFGIKFCQTASPEFSLHHTKIRVSLARGESAKCCAVLLGPYSVQTMTAAGRRTSPNESEPVLRVPVMRACVRACVGVCGMAGSCVCVGVCARERGARVCGG